LGLQAITPALAKALHLPRDAGVVVSDVLPGGPAEAAGVKLNDVLVSVDGRAVENVPAMLGFFFQHGGGEHIKFDLLRGTEKLTLDLVTAEQPHDADRLADFVDPVKDLIPALGVVGVTVNDRLESLIGTLRLPTGIVVAALLPSTTAVNSGLQVGDVIHSLNGDFVYNVEALRSGIAHLSTGMPFALLVERRGQLLYVAFEQ
jgi:serine protease Do